LRLELPQDHAGFQIWDTPTPPLLLQPDHQLTSDYSVYGSVTASTRFCTIDVTSIFGLTFFFTNGTISAIHAHTSKTPYAVLPAESLSRRSQQYVSWVYVPIPAKDQLLALALRGHRHTNLMAAPCILVRFVVTVAPLWYTRSL
jgi:hypothetical protein